MSVPQSNHQWAPHGCLPRLQVIYGEDLGSPTRTAARATGHFSAGVASKDGGRRTGIRGYKRPGDESFFNFFFVIRLYLPEQPGSSIPQLFTSR